MRVAWVKNGYRASLSLVLLLGLSLLLGTNAIANAEGDETNYSATVYTLTNATSGNAVAVFKQLRNGSLTLVDTVPAGGNGTGAGLGSQSAVTLSDNGKWLFGVNAASNTIAAFSVKPEGGVELTDVVPSGGILPISVTSNGDLVYVLNAPLAASGLTENITGFRITKAGKLVAIPNSTRSLSARGVNPAQVAFSPNGKLLVVTEKGTNKLDSYVVNEDGTPSSTATFASAGLTPFGFAFGNNNVLVVSEAASRAASSYRVSKEGRLDVISASVPTNQLAACWTVITPDGRFAYIANAGSSSLTGYRISGQGELTALNADGITGAMPAGSGPQDMAVSKNGRYLYTIDVRVGKIAPFIVQPDGQLIALDEVGGIPVGSVGLAAR